MSNFGIQIIGCSKILTINNIELEWILKTMYLLKDDILCVRGDNLKGFYLI